MNLQVVLVVEGVEVLLWLVVARSCVSLLS
jgi:hypothetical protein